jgi:hypothetical protein
VSGVKKISHKLSDRQGSSGINSSGVMCGVFCKSAFFGRIVQNIQARGLFRGHRSGG